MPDNIKSKILLVGTGAMAVEYTKIMNDLQIDYAIIGRSEAGCLKFEQQTGISAIRGGIEGFSTSNKYTHAIICTGVENLAACTIKCIQLGISDVLCEKPAALYLEEITAMKECAAANSAAVTVAYNRRFYSSVIKAKEMIAEDGGVSSFTFEFTEWAHVINPLVKAPGVKEKWIYGNSSHVIDLAFFLGGEPVQMNCFSSGKLDWHSKSKFSGAGITEDNALFSYMANWEAPGRWAVEVMTTKRRIILKPLEELYVQLKGSVQINKVEIDDELDRRYKPGLYLQTKNWLENSHKDDFLPIAAQEKRFRVINQIVEGIN